METLRKSKKDQKMLGWMEWDFEGLNSISEVWVYLKKYPSIPNNFNL